MSTMGVIHRGLNSILIDLPANESARLIEQAVRARIPVSIEPKSDAHGGNLSGTFRGCDGESVTFTLESANVDDAIRSAYCDVVFRLRGNEYLFTSVALAVSSEDEGCRLDLEYPSTLQTWQRRRFLRAAVADSAPIFIQPRGTAPEDVIEGRILNVSPDGVACRVPREAADQHTIGDSMGVTFSIGVMAEPLRFDATIVSKTPGGTRGMVIVGMSFGESAAFAAERERLAAALRAFV